MLSFACKISQAWILSAYSRTAPASKARSLREPSSLIATLSRKRSKGSSLSVSSRFLIVRSSVFNCVYAELKVNPVQHFRGTVGGIVNVKGEHLLNVRFIRDVFAPWMLSADVRPPFVPAPTVSLRLFVLPDAHECNHKWHLVIILSFCYDNC